MELFSIGNNAKTIKSDLAGEYLTAIMYLSPADSVHGINVCAMAKLAACINGCLHYAGRAQIFPAIHAARIRKTEWFRDDPVGFVDQMARDITSALRKANKMGVKLAVRPNGTSDIAWENMRGSNGLTLMDQFPDVQFYDYTKLPNRKTPANYHLTVSYSEANKAYADKVKQTRHNIAVVFRTKQLPTEYLGRKVINGDQTDLRFLDPAGVVVGLYAKGTAKKDYSGFVIDSNIIARSGQ